MAVKPAEQRLNHSLDILGAFGTLKLSVPLTTSQVRTPYSHFPTTSPPLGTGGCAQSICALVGAGGVWYATMGDPAFMSTRSCHLLQ